MDRSLAIFLRSLQTSRDFEDALRLLPTATSLLSRLSNPLNIRLLTSQILESDILYPEPVTIANSRQIFSLFYTATLRHGEDQKSKLHEDSRSTLTEKAWTNAVLQGANGTQCRWRHTLMLGGMLLAAHQRPHAILPQATIQKLERGLIMALNMTLVDKEAAPNSLFSVIFVLNHTFPSISHLHRVTLNYNVLLPLLIESIYFSREGLEYGYWVGDIDSDVQQIAGQKLGWPSRSASYSKVNEIKSRPFVSALGSLSQLTSYSIEHVRDPILIAQAIESIAGFMRTIAVAWRRNKLSGVEPGDQKLFLDNETSGLSLPSLMTMMRDTMFATVIVLRSSLGRVLCDEVLASHLRAPVIAQQCLHILRDSYFISHQFGQISSSQFAFVNFAAIDVLSQYPDQAEALVNSIKPTNFGQISSHPIDRMQDLFFLNTAEHFTLTLSTRTNEEVLLNAALPYIASNADRRLVELCEAAHSVVLAVFAALQNGDVATRHIPFYVETLMQSFPHLLTIRQFRLAIKSVIRIAAPPSQIAISFPLMQAIVLDLLNERAVNASEIILVQTREVQNTSGPPISEKAACILAIVDSLNYLSFQLLRDWLPLLAELINKVQDLRQRHLCQQEFWKALSDGNMNFERATESVIWWNTRGGREMLLHGELPDDEDHFMSGAVDHGSKL